MGVEVEGWLHGPDGVVHHHLARASLGVGIAVSLQGGHGAALRGEDVARPTGRAGRQAQGGAGVALGDGSRRLAHELERGFRDQETGAGIDLHDRLGGVAIGDRRLDLVGVIALRAEHGDGLIDGFGGAAAGLQAALRRTLAIPDGSDDGVPQGAILDAPDLGPGFGGERPFRESAEEVEARRCGEGPGRSFHQEGVPCSAPQRLC